MEKNQTEQKAILIVEDDTFMASLLERKFKQNNFQIFRAASVDEAREIIKANPINLILQDIILPGTDGISFLKELKMNPQFKHIPVIITSNLGQQDEIDRGLAEGANDYIVKAHATPGEIVEKVTNILSQ
ncbi:MAG: response regulator [Parcubacteria group bacterium]|jgi:DNA-binding response OmpR family regulator